MLRRRLAEARDEYAARAREGRGGLDVLARYADRMDGLVREIAESAGAQTTMPIAVCALGGYGRRTLCLHSDIDLLIVTEGPIGSREELAISSLLQPLWDLRLTVGQHVRELADFTRVETGQRGAAARAARHPVPGRPPGSVRPRSRRRLETTASERAPSRRTRPPRAAGGSTRTVQPDDLPARTGREGGAGRTSRHRSDSGSCRSLRPDLVIDRPLAESERLRDAEEFLFRAPLAAARRDRAQLERADSRTPGNRRGGDGLRRRGAAAAGRAADVRLLPPGPSRGSRPLGFARGTGAGAPRRGAPSSHRPASRDRRRRRPLRRSRARRVDAGDVARSVPSRARRTAAAVSEQARTCIEQNVDALHRRRFRGDRRRPSAAAQPARAAAGPLRIGCPRCTTAGCSACIFPEFAQIHSRVVRDFYHRYTVDEHTLLAIRNIESLRDVDVESGARALRRDARPRCTRRSS